MFRLVKSTHQSDSLAFAATISSMALPISQFLAADVMLEFPALAFMLGALYCLCDLDKAYPWSRAYPFALLTAAAVWTSNTQFLGCPFPSSFFYKETGDCCAAEPLGLVGHSWRRNLGPDEIVCAGESCRRDEAVRRWAGTLAGHR